MAGMRGTPRPGGVLMARLLVIADHDPDVYVQLLLTPDPDDPDSEPVWDGACTAGNCEWTVTRQRPGQLWHPNGLHEAAEPAASHVDSHAPAATRTFTGPGHLEETGYLDGGSG